MEVNGERAIGYPTKEGARHLLVANAPLAMRSTATEEQKKIAYTFLKMLLSKEIMEKTSSTMMFPVRKDVLEKKLMDYEATVESMKLGEGYDPNYMPELDEKDREFLNNLIETGVVKKSFPAGLKKVFDEELGDYLAGRIDGKALEDHLKNRVWLYLNETK
jgi:ABC-type glycerol-3-phosphate transport system substrate-binding protein